MLALRPRSALNDVSWAAAKAKADTQELLYYIFSNNRVMSGAATPGERYK